MKFFPAFFVLLLLAAPLRVAAGNIEKLLSELNHALDNKAVYFKQRVDRIAALTRQFEAHRTDDQAGFALGQRIYEEYSSFEYDSAFAYAQRVRRIATKLNSPQKAELSKLNLAFIQVSSGMFKEAFDMLGEIHPALLDSAGRAELYFVKARAYTDLADFNSGSYYRSAYTAKAIACTDTALRFSKPGTYEYLLVQGFRELKNNNIAASRATYGKILALPHLTPHQFAVNASTAAWVWELSGNQEKSFELLIQAAIADVKTATTEAVALFKVSELCYRRGNLKDAYTFIKHAREDAVFYNARLRLIQIGGIFSVIEGQKINIIEKQRKGLELYSIITTTLVLLVIVFAVIIFRQLRKLQSAEATISAINQELQQNNEHLSFLNHNLNDANRIKDEYIGYYFNISSQYIDRLEALRASLEKSLASKLYGGAQKTVDNINIKRERNELFKGFDTVFLKLFPNFVAAFNALLRPEEQIQLAEDQLLNTELRIFALIRLGIDDSERIGKILGYTISTIYTYKTRVKKKSIFSSDEVEGKVRAIQAA